MRHGELQQKGCLVGRSDFLLSAVGQQQMENKFTQLLTQDKTINQIITSPLSRCCMLAKQAATKFHIPLITEPAIQEMDFGDWDGATFHSLWQQESADHHIGDFWENPWQYSPPNGETMYDFSARIQAWWLSLHQHLKNERAIKNTTQENSCIVVSHAGVIKHILALITGLNIKENKQLTVFDVPYGGVIKIVVYYDNEHKPWPRIVF